MNRDQPPEAGEGKILNLEARVNPEPQEPAEPAGGAGMNPELQEPTKNPENPEEPERAQGEPGNRKQPLEAEEGKNLTLTLEAGVNPELQGPAELTGNPGSPESTERTQGEPGSRQQPPEAGENKAPAPEASESTKAQEQAENPGTKIPPRRTQGARRNPTGSTPRSQPLTIKEMLKRQIQAPTTVASNPLDTPRKKREREETDPEWTESPAKKQQGTLEEPRCWRRGQTRTQNLTYTHEQEPQKTKNKMKLHESKKDKSETRVKTARKPKKPARAGVGLASSGSLGSSTQTW